VLVIIFYCVLPFQDDDDLQKAQSKALGERHTANAPARYILPVRYCALDCATASHE
jgi:hypothetical protein